MEFIPGIQNSLNIEKLSNVIHNTNRLQKLHDHSNQSINVEKATDKIQHPPMTKP